jgi:hypothetical protein
MAKLRPVDTVTHRLYTHTSPRAAHREHDGLAPLHLTCEDGKSQDSRIKKTGRQSLQTLRLRQASQEKALLRCSVESLEEQDSDMAARKEGASRDYDDRASTTCAAICPTSSSSSLEYRALDELSQPASS